jgi:hypothetical protein
LGLELIAEITILIGDFSLKFYLKSYIFHGNRDEIAWANG